MRQFFNYPISKNHLNKTIKQSTDQYNVNNQFANWLISGDLPGLEREELVSNTQRSRGLLPPEKHAAMR